MSIVKLSRQRLWQLEHIKQGLCTSCSRPALKGIRNCAEHQRGKTRRPRKTLAQRERFFKLWNSEAPVWEVATVLKSTPQTLRSLARYYRAKGVPLRNRSHS